MKKIQLDSENQNGLKIIIFVEGTILKPKHWYSIYHHKSYIPIDGSLEKCVSWNQQGASIMYITSRKHQKAIDIAHLLRNFGFVGVSLLYREPHESYKQLIEAIQPDVLIEDDCKSIGGAWQMCITNVSDVVKDKLVSIVVPEFKGIAHLPSNIKKLLNN